MHHTEESNYKRIANFLESATKTPATLDELENIECELKTRFPESYRKFQLEFGDFCHEKIEVFTVSSSDTCSDNIVDVRKHISQYGSDAFHQAFNGALPDIPETYIPFSYYENDYYCFDMNHYDGSECPVVYFTETLNKHDEPIRIADTFIDWFVLEINKTEE